MNVDTGHLVENLDDVEESKRTMYDQIPEPLQEEARLELRGRKETHVQLDRRDSKLAKWARKRRTDKSRRKTKNAMAKSSRRRNRS